MRNAPVTPLMPFGKFKGQPIEACDTQYLGWFVRECRNAPATVLAAARDELDRRQTRRLADARPSSSSHTPALPSKTTRNAVVRLVSDLIAAGTRVVARGEGAVYCYGNAPRADLEHRLRHLHAELDALARALRYYSNGNPRITLATTALAGLRVQGFVARALHDGTISWWPSTPLSQPLLDALGTVQSEAWFRVAVDLPLPDMVEVEPVAVTLPSPQVVQAPPASQQPLPASPASQQPSPQAVPLAALLPDHRTPPVEACQAATAANAKAEVEAEVDVEVHPPASLESLLAFCREHAEHCERDMLKLAQVGGTADSRKWHGEPQQCARRMKLAASANEWRAWQAAVDAVVRKDRKADRQALTGLRDYIAAQWRRLRDTRGVGEAALRRWQEWARQMDEALTWLTRVRDQA